AITSSAVIGVPSLHLAFFLSFTVQTVASLETEGKPSARSGTTFRFLSTEYRFGRRNDMIRNSGSVEMTNGFKLVASESIAQINVPPFLGVSDDGAALPQAATRIAIVAATIGTRHRFDLPSDTSMYVNYLPSRAVMGRRPAAGWRRIAVIMHYAISIHQEKASNISLY